ncbi:MAG: hypothetical protein ACFFEV_08195 [Candidatus Thorarchaeota archaeon]
MKSELPHTGIIDESLEGEQELLMRARLHTRGGFHRFSQGMISDAIAAFYDALSSAMQRYIIVNEIPTYNVDISEDSNLFKVIHKSGVFDDTTTLEDFDFIERTLDDALENRLESFDETSFLEIVVSLLNQLEIISDQLDIA